MALTRAQLLMGNISDGTVLNGQPQGVRPGGNGITIRTDGVIEVNSQSIQGVMKLGQSTATANAAYNQYEWPTAPGVVGQQLEIVSISGGVSTLNWADPDGIDWTQKGQLLAATGAGTSNETLVNVGADGSVLVADSSTLSGLNYTNQIQTAITVPSGTSPAQRPSSPVAGSFRWSTTLGCLEVFNGLKWESVASDDPSVGTFVAQTVPVFPTSETGSAVIPAGTVAERQTLPAPGAGNFRWNTDLVQLEVWDGTAWAQLPASAGTDFVPQTRPAPGFTASAVIPPGLPGQAEAAAAGGYLRYNSTANYLEFHNGSSWELVAPSGGGVHSFVQAATPTAYNSGDIWYDTVLERESVWDGSAWVQPGVTQTSPDGAALLPWGPTASQPPAASVLGGIRLNTDTSQIEYSDGVTWGNISFPTGTRMIFVQATAPAGWTQVTSAAFDDSAIRVVNVGGGLTGGATGFSSSFASYTPAGSVDTSSMSVTGITVSGTVFGAGLSQGQLPSITGTFQGMRGGGPTNLFTNPSGCFSVFGQDAKTNEGNSTNVYGGTNIAYDNGGAGQAHSHGFAGSAGGGSLTGTANFNGSPTSQFDVKYINTIICQKN